MSTSSEPLNLIATSAFGLEAVVARELTTLGYEPQIIQAGRILFRGSEADICRANLWLRAADRVLVRLAAFPAADFGQLFDGTRAIAWEAWLPADAEFPVSGRSLKSQLSSVPACQKIVKKAIVERLKAAYGNEWFAETGPKFSIEVALLDDQATLILDTSGPGLHKRGYRPLTGHAPLKETLAAAMVMLSVWRPERPLADPFCGSGTIPIEAALIGRNIAPGLNRTFLAEGWPRMPTELWDAAREAARAAIRPSLPQRIVGTDIDEGSLGLARFHAEKAGVSADIHFQQRAFADLAGKRDYGCVICNPPYGERLGESAEAIALHRAMPDVFRRLKTWSFFVLTALPDFEAVIGQSATRRRKLYNGRIECTYYQFLGPKPGRSRERGAGSGEQEAGSGEQEAGSGEQEAGSGEQEARSREQGVETECDDRTSSSDRSHEFDHAQAVSCSSDTPSQELSAQLPAPRSPLPAPRPSLPPRPVFGGLSAKAHEQAAIFAARLANRARHLRRWPTKLGVTCYRVYEQDVPEIPLVVDRYEDCLHVAEFARPTDHTPAEHADWLDLMLRTAAETLDVPPQDVFLKRRERQRGAAQYERLDGPQRSIVAREGGLQFEVNLANYLDTGLFLDHRITRGMVRAAAAGKHFLNLFAYTGSFSVYAAAGGAAETVTVDLSNTYLDWAQRNLALNGFTGPEHQLVRDDAMHFLQSRRSRHNEPLFDLAVVDAPTFSNSKSLDDYWDIQRNHAALLGAVAGLLSPGGTIFFSTNFRRFKLAEAELAGLSIREISRQTVPPDFRNRRIHRCWRMVKANLSM